MVIMESRVSLTDESSRRHLDAFVESRKRR